MFIRLKGAIRHWGGGGSHAQVHSRPGPSLETFIHSLAKLLLNRLGGKRKEIAAAVVVQVREWMHIQVLELELECTRSTAET